MTVARKHRSLRLISEWTARNLAPRRLALTLALVVCAYGTTAIVLLLPDTSTFRRIPTFHGHDAVAWSYVSYATGIGLSFSLSPYVSALRGLVLTYAAMGVAGVASLAYITLVIFPDGYIKAPGSLWSALASLAVANLVTGTAALWIGLRCSLVVAALGALAALMSVPFRLAVHLCSSVRLRGSPIPSSRAVRCVACGRAHRQRLTAPGWPRYTYCLGPSSGGVTPVPIPNTVVKPTSAKDTRDVGPRENRSGPG